MVSQFSFFLNLYSSLLGVPLSPDNGFSKVLALFPRRLATQVLLGLACTSFSARLCSEAYTQFRSLWVRHQLELLARLVDHRNLIVIENDRKFKKFLAVKEEVERDMAQWIESTKEHKNILNFVLLDRELPFYPVDSTDADLSLIWEQQNEEILNRDLALEKFRAEIKKKVVWMNEEQNELIRLTNLDKEDVKRIRNKVKSLSFFGLQTT